MSNPVLSAVQVLFRLLFILILTRAVLSWIRPSRFSRSWYELERFIHLTTEPILAPIRRIMPPMAGLDLTPVVAIILLGIVENLVVSLLR